MGIKKIYLLQNVSKDQKFSNFQNLDFKWKSKIMSIY